jgi:cysteine desulfurase/selenocysteine lyase
MPAFRALDSARTLRHCKSDFPILRRTIDGAPLVYLDNAATAQKPQAVIDALVRFYSQHNANVHRGVHRLAEEATELYEGARANVARLIGAADPRSIVFTRGTTAAINLVAQGWARHALRSGDEILVTEMEHHSNLVPWQMAAQATGARLRYLGVTDDGRLDLAQLDALLSPRTRLVALTHTSNVLGTINPVAAIARRAHAAGALVLVDAAQAAPRMTLDVAALDCDFLAFSGHKLYGPTGIGVLYGRPALLEAMEPADGGGGMIRRVGEDTSEWAEPPWKFEAGTPPIAEAVALGAAVDYVSALGLDAIWRHEADLTGYALAALTRQPDVTVYGPAAGQTAGPAVGPERAGVISFNVADFHPHDVAQVLDQAGVAVRGGHHCCQPLMRRLGTPAVVRASVAVYNDESDIDRLMEGLGAVRKVLSRGPVRT